MLKDSTERSSAISSAMSGRACRLLMNDFLRDLKPLEHLLPPFPIWLAMTADIRKAASAQQDRSVATLLCGQGSALAEHNVSAKAIFDRIVAETSEVCEH
jgi:nitronate monooxygenase